jgi:hypothetical protein
MSSPRRSVDHRLAAWLAVGALVVAACSGGATASPPVVSAPSASAAVTAGSTRPVTPTPASSPASSPAAPIPDGDYLSGYVTKDTAKAMLTDPAIVNDPLVKDFLDHYEAATRTRLHLANGKWTQAIEQQAGSLGIGDEGTYAFVDDHTIALQSTHVAGTYQLGFTLAGDTLTWKVLSGPNGTGDLATVRVIFEATPFIRQP